MIENDRLVCDAGRTVTLRTHGTVTLDFGGRWTEPCDVDVEAEARIHTIGTETGDAINLCERHFLEMQAAGLVSHPYRTPEEYRAYTGNRAS